MARRFKRRRKPVQWLPPIGFLFNTTGGGSGTTIGRQSSAITFLETNLAVGPNNVEVVVEFPLTIADNRDTFYDAAAAAFSAYQAQNLAEEQGFGYSIRRIVGACPIWVSPPDDDQTTITPSIVEVSAGIIVRRAASAPNESALHEIADINVSPMTLENATDPWMWRRCWWFSPANAGGPNTPSSPAATDGFASFAQTLQPTNTVFTGMNNTSSFDIKTRRVVKREERLFFNLHARAVGVNPAASENYRINLGGVLDYRILATTFVAKDTNRNNASR